MNGLRVAELVALDDLIERGNVCQLSAQILITKSVLGILMKEEYVMKSVAQVSHFKACDLFFITVCSIRKATLELMDLLVCL